MENLDIDYLSMIETPLEGDCKMREFENLYNHSGKLGLHFKNYEMPGILISRWTGLSNTHSSFSAEKTPEAVNMNFMLSGTMRSRLHANNSDFIIKKLQHNLIYLENFDGRHDIQDGTTSAFHVMFDKSYFCRLIDYNEEQSGRFLEKIDKKEGFFANKHMMPVQSDVLTIINDITSCKLKGPFRRIFMEGKALELLSQTLAQAEQYTPARQKLNAHDLQRIKDVKEYLDCHYLNPGSMLEICRMFCLNDYKLKTGFRAVYQNSVFGYIHLKKMTLAKKLLEDGQMSVAEVSDCVGYENANHFSAAFKKHFGFSPSQLKR
ncbi:AraC family transcriptional regulator [Dyadobacter sp. LJ53]|uniref:helix-turn-helix domain-containing protein n=1 Tax=Dyadobacter chenwenxiniae TaxID=2906456 RepID=UPI001F33C32E|nr:AraC family transcriptional regulator [Dyadobacter chenwenxiniae]MCF0051665.1 AraC family transcriptional regulator [Dyadobacter chenwenxiniae]